MPRTKVILFRENDGRVPLLAWLDTVPTKAKVKCRLRIERLHEFGHELRRPEADYLRDGIYELRVGFQGINYRMLYFFHESMAAVVSHGLVKQQEIPQSEIEKAIRRKQAFIINPILHTEEHL